jgi:hypothetical protein
MTSPIDRRLDRLETEVQKRAGSDDCFLDFLKEPVLLSNTQPGTRATMAVWSV